MRLPDGTRCGRRFRRTDPLKAAFDFIDVRCCGDGSGGGAGGGGGEQAHGGALRPGGYRLVTQFPRKVFEEGQGGSFEEAGLNTDSALFVEML